MSSTQTQLSSSTSTQLPPSLPLRGHDSLDEGKTCLTVPIVLTGVLDKYEHHESTPVIGREYSVLQVKSWLGLPREESDPLFRELAATGLFICHPCAPRMDGS